MVRKRAKSSVNVRGFLQENNAVIRQPAVIGLPGLPLSHHLVGTHYGRSREKPEQTDLSKPTEANARFHVQFLEPYFGDAVVNVAPVGQGDPYVHIREKE